MIPHKPVYEFHSVFASQMRGYIELKETLGEKITVPGNTLRQFDRYCCSVDINEASLTKELADSWLLTKAGEKPETRSTRISVLWCFARYLKSTGNSVSWHPVPGYAGRIKRYVPYIFSKNEISKLFAAANAMHPSYNGSRFHLVFPAVLRVMYACGLRATCEIKRSNQPLRTSQHNPKRGPWQKQKRRQIPNDPRYGY